MKFIKYFLFLLSVSFFIRSYSMQDESINEDDFSGKKPFFVITITRDAKSVMLKTERVFIEDVIRTLFNVEANGKYKIDELVSEDEERIKTVVKQQAVKNETNPYSCSLLKKQITDPSKLKESYSQGLDKVYESIKKHSTFINNLKNGNGIIVFNEMFFGKEAPYIHEQYEETIEEFNNLSNQIKNKLFCVNLLFENKNDIPENYAEKLLGILNCRDDVNSGKEDNIYIPCSGFKPQPLSRLHDTELDDNDINKSRKEYIMNAYVAGKNKDTIENSTTVFLNGRRVAQYRKCSYYNESSWHFKKNIPYMFGDKNLEFLTDDDKVNGILENHISFQICRDLLCKVGSESKNGTLHIFQSNSLSFLSCKENLPPNVKNVIHADPQFSEENGEFYCRRMRINVDNDKLTELRWEIGGQYIFSIQFQFNGATYNITVRDIQNELKR